MILFYLVDISSARWEYGDFGNCSVACGIGEKKRQETSCITAQYKTVFSCNFGISKGDMCGFKSTAFVSYYYICM